MVRVLIADNSPNILDSIASLLAAQPDLDLVGTARDGVEAIEKSSDLLPDVVIMDAQMPRMDGVEATRRIKQDLPGVGVLFFSVYTDYLEASVAAGADGYVSKDCKPAELFDEIRRIASNSQLTH